VWRSASLGPLDLDHDLAAARQRGPVHLAERGGGQRLLLELREEVADLAAELGLDDLGDDVEPERLGVVLEPRQRGGVRRGQQVEAGRQQLAELDVRRAELLEVPRERRRLRLVPHRRVLVEGELVEPDPGDQVGAAVTGQQPREGGVPSDVPGAQGRHAGQHARSGSGES
jgi:hypothetical protein